ncbi:N-acetylmuramoyl-L-alanine amidase [Chitinophaga horti]|uniref:N-acetylmuramoyl-L-alanine amidase n=1 Tax=Chitinophaga horti TaxID=2920382 RepID=A0ABY6J044_9BACT|nr:N-acetylmuramoyl-L-alanine amidase [Chitinophaga horti]UYQ93038.1 N-acetylmuramoyl-L-alanine amidase [Chitinophaga horti]
MPQFLQYLLQSSVCLLACYLLYLLVFRRLTFFGMSRLYLLLALVASLVIPLLRIAVPEQVAPVAMPVIDATPIAIASGSFEADMPEVAPQAPLWPVLLLAGYVLGALVVLARLMLGLKGLWKLMRQGEKLIIDGYRVVLTNGVNASFAPYIFVDRNAFNSADRAQILLHEKTHIRLYHAADLLLLEVVSVLCWFNPVTWFYRRSLKEVHEYQVDRVVSGQTDIKAYASLLLRLATAGRSYPVNTFSMQPLKGRITMLFTHPSHHMKKLLFALAIPVVAALLYSFSLERKPVITSGEKNFVLLLDASHGGDDAGAVGHGAKEKELTLLLVKEIGEQAKAVGFEVNYTRTGDETVGLKERVAQMETNKADLFLSVHVDAVNNADAGNSAIYLNTRNAHASSSANASRILYAQLKNLEGLPVKNLPMHMDKVMVLEKASTAAVLLSMGNMLHEADLKLLSDAKWRTDFGAKVVQALQNIKTAGAQSTTLHEMMGVPEEMTHIWQMERPRRTVNADGEVKEGC